MPNLKDPLVQIKSKPEVFTRTADLIYKHIWTVTSTVCSFVAIGTTIYRLAVRWGRLWADDAWAFFSLLTLLIQITGVFMHVPDPSRLSRTNRVAAYYLMATSFYAIIWSARLSILFSIVRLDPSERRRRRLLFMACLFIGVCIFLIAQLFWVCEPEPDWKDARSPQCTLNKEVAICQLVTDIVADLILIIAPLKLLAGLEDKTLRLRLMVIFSTCIVTTIVSLVHASYILTLGGPKVVIAALVEDCISLIVCNIPVVVTATIRLREESKPPRGPKISTDMKFTSRIFSNKATTRATSFSMNETNTASTRNSRADPLLRSKGGPDVGTNSYFLNAVGKDSVPETNTRTSDNLGAV